MQEKSIRRSDLRTSYPIILLCAMFVIGMLYGVLLLKLGSGSLSEAISLITAGYRSKLQSLTVVESFFSAFSSAFAFVLIPYLLGYSAVFQPLILLLPWFKGLGLGFFMANIYLSYGFSGMGFCALFVIPQTVIVIFCMIVACREALKLSNMFFFSFAGKSRECVTLNSVRLYNIKFAVLSGMCLLAAIVDVLCSLIFSGLFDFT